MAESDVVPSDRLPQTSRNPSFLPIAGMGLGGPPHFRLLGIPVRVSAGFWLMSVLLGGAGTTSADAPGWAPVRDVVLWTAVVFVSVLLHELGHALSARAFGAAPAILLHTMGGLTVYDQRFSRWKGAIVSVAGPAVGVVSGALLYAGLAHSRWVVAHPIAQILVEDAVWVNLGWGLINLSPVLPFDGGHILAAVLGPKRVLATSLVSFGFGALVVAYALSLHLYFMAAIFGSAALGSTGQIRLAWAQRADRRRGFEARISEAKRALAEGDARQAEAVAAEVLREAKTERVRDAASILLAWVHVSEGNGVRARQALANLSSGAALDPYTLAAVEDADGNRVGALQILEIARERGQREAQATKLLVDLYARGDDLERAAAVAAEDVSLLSLAEARTVLSAAIESRANTGAAALASAIFERHGRADDAVAEARARSALGDVDGALRALERAISLFRGEGGAGVVKIQELASDAGLERLGEDPRFLRLVDAR